MKRIKLLLILFIPLVLEVYSQTEYNLYEPDQTMVDSYLDSICKLYVKNLDTYKDLDLSVPIKSTRGAVCRIFGDSIKLRTTPSDSSKYLKLLNFKDNVFIPQFKGRLQYYPLTFNIRPGRYDYYLFCISEEGFFGFINSEEYTHSNNYIKDLPNTEYLLIERPKKAIVKKDYSTFKIFDAYNVNYSANNKSLVYAIEDYNSENLGKIFTFDIDRWTENNIGHGYSPVFMEDDIVYWTKNDEKIHRFNYKTQEDSTIFSVPDSLTMWLCGPDFCFPRKITIKNVNGENLIYLKFCSKLIKSGEDECGTEVKYLITKKGEIVNIE